MLVLVYVLIKSCIRREPIELSQRAQNPGEYTFTVSVTGGKVFLFGLYAGTGRAEEIADLIGRFSTHLGDLNMTFTPQDGPGVQLGWYHKEKMIELAKVGECRINFVS